MQIHSLLVATSARRQSCMAFPSDHGDPDPRARREMRAPAPSNEKTMIIEAWGKKMAKKMCTAGFGLVVAEERMRLDPGKGTSLPGNHTQKENGADIYDNR